MKHNNTIKLSLLVVVLCIVSCNAYKYGYTEKKALNAYYLVIGNENNFGDKRIKYNESFHRCPCFKTFLDSKGYPGFIYEYKTDTKCKGIKLFYPTIDSVFVFEEAKKNKRYSFIKESRKMNDAEKEIYQQLNSRFFVKNEFVIHPPTLLPHFQTLSSLFFYTTTAA